VATVLAEKQLEEVKQEILLSDAHKKKALENASGPADPPEAAAGASGSRGPQDLVEMRTDANGDPYLVHYVSSRDTLVGLGLKYNVRVTWNSNGRRREYSSRVLGNCHKRRANFTTESSSAARCS